MSACLLFIVATLPPAPGRQEQSISDLAILRSTEGAWEGTLTYRDFGSDRSVSIPARLRSEAVGTAMAWKLRLHDPGRTIESLDVATVENASVLTVRSFGPRGVEEQRHRLTFRSVKDTSDWTLGSEGTGQDGGKDASFRRTWSLVDGVLSQKVEVRVGAEPWFVRNELRLRKPVVDARALVGRWKVDLRPNPDSEPYFKTMVIRAVKDGAVSGSFYDTDVKNGRVNVDWGAVRFAFTTGDGTGAYHTHGVLRGDRIEGTTHSAGRGFLAVWSAVREK